jgi:hypothetical protein
MWQRARAKGGGDEAWTTRALTTFFTFQFVCLAWVFFRAPTFAHATLLLSRIAKGTTDAPNLSSTVLVTLAAGFLVHLVPSDVRDRMRERFIRLPAPVMGAFLALAAYGLHLAAGAKAQPFVYGQF